MEAFVLLSVMLFSLVFLVWFAVAATWGQHRHKAALAALARLGPVKQRSEGSGKSRQHFHEVVLHIRAVEIAVQLRGSRLRFDASIRPKSTDHDALPVLPILVLRRERAIDRLGKALRLNREVQSGDPAFDRSVYVESDAVSDDIAAIVRRPAVRAATSAVLDRGATEIATANDPRPLHVTFPGRARFIEEEALAAADELVVLVDALPRFVDHERPRRAHGERWPLVSFVAGFVAVLPAAFFHSHYPVIGGTMRGHIFGVGAVFWGLASVAALRHLRGRPRSLRYFGWTSAAWLFTGPIVAASVLLALNGLGPQVVSRRDTTVEDLQVRRSKNSTTYIVTVAPWAPHRAPLELVATPGAYARLQRGAPVVVSTGPGNLGFEWLRDVQPR